MKYYRLEVLKDNYIWLLVKGNNAIAIDCGEEHNLLNFITQNKLNLNYILITHHHSDHIAGLLKVKEATNAKIIGSAKTAELIANNTVDHIITAEEDLNLNGTVVSPIFTEGHSEGHVVYFLPQRKWLFSGDTLFTLACGRAFYNMELLFNSLQKIVQEVPKESLVFPGHNYLENNLKFLEYINYFNFRAKNSYFNSIAIPNTLANELYYNPFLNANNKEFKSFMRQEDLSDFAFFSYLRKLKDSF